jgi:hypothetical protein
MIMRIVIALACLTATLLPSGAGELKAEDARRLVVGKLFSFNCFEGTTGAGRVFADGSVAGIIRFQGSATFRNVRMPPNTLRVKGGAVCASVRGMTMEPCFTLTQLDERTFRGAITGLSFASCQFTQRGGRGGIVHNTSAPHSLHSSVADKE